jgi:hypothetical protein
VSRFDSQGTIPIRVKDFPMPSTRFPARPISFGIIKTPSRSRILLLSSDPKFAPVISQVATVDCDVSLADRLVEALNRAAWTGDTSLLDLSLTELPPGVVQSCREALAVCPAPETIARGDDGAPLEVIRQASYLDRSSDLAVDAESAVSLGLQFLIEGAVDDRGRFSFETTLLAGDATVAPTGLWSWWPTPPGLRLVERVLPTADELRELLQDDRWETNVARGYWLWVRDGEEERNDYEATATWIVEFFDAPLNPMQNFRVFLQDDGLDEEDRGYLTVRTRFLLWVCLWNMAADLDGLVIDMWDDVDGSVVRGDMPRMVQEQPREWWEVMRDSADRLCEAARLGDIEALEPRTPAEEALIFLATRDDYVEWARDSLELGGRQAVFDALPVSPDDEVWEEILPQLTGDIDIEMFWTDDLVGHANPADAINRSLGIGDYRPEAWHTLFERATEPEER